MEVLSNILIQFGITMKLVRLIEMYLNETFSRVQVGKHMCDMLPVLEWFETRKCFIATAFQWFKVCHYDGLGKPGWLEIKWYTSAFGL